MRTLTLLALLGTTVHAAVFIGHFGDATADTFRIVARFHRDGTWQGKLKCPSHNCAVSRGRVLWSCSGSDIYAFGTIKGHDDNCSLIGLCQYDGGIAYGEASCGRSDGPIEFHRR